MRNVAGFTLTLASAFLAVVALMLNSPALFYMGTALVGTIGACRLQAWLAVRGLRFERIAPESVQVGDLVTVEITVWSEFKIRRPLIEVVDNRPQAMLSSGLTASLPIAAAYDLPIRTQYQFRPMKRGNYHWSGLSVEGTDALGLVTQRRQYSTSVAEMTVLPRPIPVSIELPASAGWGISEAESGQTRGAGLEPRGVRNYVNGDSLRHVHWRSTAKRGELLVKEFEAGTHAAAAFVIQLTKGSDIGKGAHTSLEVICGHAVYMAEAFLRQGARVVFPGLDPMLTNATLHERINEIYEMLARIEANSSQTLGDQTAVVIGSLPAGSVLYVMMSVADQTLVDGVRLLAGKGTTVVPLVYDCRIFEPRTRSIPATDPSFMGALRDAGAVPTIMPVEVSNG
ncbi:MAG: DUF58 domain-containing protein [Fimbriimonas sp.]|nr:DUF58 domain-containing protein [Fimbriimonas sp.]